MGQGGGGDGEGWGGSKKSKLIPTVPRGVGQKSCPIPTPPPLWGGENQREAKWGEVG